MAHVDPNFNPFLNPDPGELTVGPIGEHHTVHYPWNKFPLAARHLVLARRCVCRAAGAAESGRFHRTGAW